jgi:hypothetical protein
MFIYIHIHIYIYYIYIYIYIYKTHSQKAIDDEGQFFLFEIPVIYSRIPKTSSKQFTVN